MLGWIAIGAFLFFWGSAGLLMALNPEAQPDLPPARKSHRAAKSPRMPHVRLPNLPG